MEFSTIIGIDVSKLTLDLHVLPGGQITQVVNDKKGIKSMFRWLEKTCKIELSCSLFSFESTGFYSYTLAAILQDNGLSFAQLPGLELKRSLGISRGKDDRIDAEKIASYTYLRRSIINLTQLPEKEIEKMKQLLSLRDRLVKQRAGFKTTLSEARRAVDPKENHLYFQIQEEQVKQLTKGIDQIEKQLHELIDQHPYLKKQYDLIISIVGVGPIMALTMIAITHAFTKFPCWRKFACYAGIAPFPNRSGTSIHGKTKVSHLANKKIKSLLGNLAASAIQHNSEMKIYYKRRLEEGKDKMSTQNIIRNKLLARIFAVVQRGTPYVDVMKFAA